MIIESNKKYEQHPATAGPIRAVVVDVTEPKEKQTAYGLKNKFAIVFETDMKMPDGKPWTFWSHGYTPVLGDKSNLKKDALKIMGTDRLGEKFETEDMIGKPVKLIIEHRRNTDGEIYANMTWLGPDMESDAMKPSGSYVRQKDKNKDPNNTGSTYNRTDGAQEEAKEPWQQTKVHVGRSKGQEVENLDTDSLQALIKHWVPNTYDGYKAKPADPPYKVTADDKRLLFALGEAQKAMAAMSQPASDF